MPPKLFELRWMQRRGVIRLPLQVVAVEVEVEVVEVVVRAAAAVTVKVAMKIPLTPSEFLINCEWYQERSKAY